MTPTLRDLIAGATPGPWDSPQSKPLVFRDEEGQNFSGGDWTIYPPLGESGPVAIAGNQANAQLIARCNPATMLLVIDALDLAQQNYNRTNNDQPDDMGDDEHEAWGAILKALTALNSPQNES